MYFESCVPTEWETTHLPVILIMADSWDPTTFDMSAGKQSREDEEMQSIRSLTSNMIKRAISAMLRYQSNSRHVCFEQVEQELTKIATVFNDRTFCRRLIGAVNIATTIRDDIDGWEDERRVQSIITNYRHSNIGPDELSRKWNIGLQTAKDTLAATTQHGVRTAVHPMSRRLRVDHLHLQRPLLRGTWYADTLLSKVKSIRGNTCANVFTQGRFTKVVPMKSRSDAGQSLVDFTDDVGIPERLVKDGAGELTGKGKKFMK